MVKINLREHFQKDEKERYDSPYNIMWDQIGEEAPGVLQYRFQLELIELFSQYRGIENAIRRISRSL